MNISSTHVIHGCKTALAAVLAYTITTLLNLELGYWAVLTSVIVMQVYVADSVEMCLYRFSGTIAGAFFGVLVMLVTPKDVFSISIALFITIGICSFLTRYQTRYRMAAITVVIIVMTGISADNIIFFAMSRVFEICIGILCAFTVSVLIAPKRRVDLLMGRLESQSADCADKCTALVDAFVSRQRHVEQTFVDELLKNVWDNHAMLQKIRQHEALIYHKKLDRHFSDKVTLMSRSTEHLRNMVRTLNSPGRQDYDIIMARELETIAKESGKTLSAIMGGHIPPANEADELEQAIAALDTRLITIRNQGMIRRFDTDKLIQVFSFYSSLRYFAEDILSGAKKILNEES